MTEFVVPYHGQGSIFDETDVAAVTNLLLSGKHLSSGTERSAFEQEFAGSVGACHAVSVTSCTMALELATYLLDLRPGDEVIASPLTFQATVAPLLTRRVTVRFADIDPESLALDPASVQRLIGPSTRAVYVTHYGGLAADLDRLRELADAHGIALLEDCAHALGTLYHGRSVGTIGDVGCWSFHSLKTCPRWARAACSPRGRRPGRARCAGSAESSRMLTSPSGRLRSSLPGTNPPSRTIRSGTARTRTRMTAAPSARAVVTRS